MNYKRFKQLINSGTSFILGTLTCFLIAFASLSAHAESALHALGQAQNDEYRDMKSLPPNASVQQREAVHAKDFAHANDLLHQENEKQIEQAKQSSASLIKQAFKRAIARIVGKTAEAPADGASQAAGAAAPARAGKTTGLVGGAGGAKAVDLSDDGSSASPDNAPVVKDGIIQDTSSPTPSLAPAAAAPGAATPSANVQDGIIQDR